MKVWRGIFTRKSRSETLIQGFAALPADLDSCLDLILEKILDNLDASNGTRKLTAFSKSKKVALRHAGNQGWLLELEIAHQDILDVEPFLESRRNLTAPGSPEWERITEAKDMAHHDKEIFLRHGAVHQVTRIHMVGSWNPES